MPIPTGQSTAATERRERAVGPSLGSSTALDVRLRPVLQKLDLLGYLGCSLFEIALVFLEPLNPLLATRPARKPWAIPPAATTADASVHRSPRESMGHATRTMIDRKSVV